MDFRPKMTSQRQGVEVMDALKWRAWNGVVVDLWHARCAAGARGHYVSRHPRVFVVLDASGGDFRTRAHPTGDDTHAAVSGSISYVPAHAPVWADVDGEVTIRHLDLHFDPDVIASRLAERIDSRRLSQLRLGFQHPGVLQMARLLAEECANDDPRHDLYGDSLVLALLIDMFEIGRAERRVHARLGAAQLRRVTDYIEAHCSSTIRLQDLADMVGLSQSYFSHAFKAATGVPPHRWQIQARVRRGQELMLTEDRTLPEIAAEIGFADQAHFTRAFRRVVGETPASWRRSGRLARGRPKLSKAI